MTEYVIIGKIRFDEDMPRWYVGRILWEDAQGALVERRQNGFASREFAEAEKLMLRGDDPRKLQKTLDEFHKINAAYKEQLCNACEAQGAIRRELRAKLTETVLRAAMK